MWRNQLRAWVSGVSLALPFVFTCLFAADVAVAVDLQFIVADRANDQPVANAQLQVTALPTKQVTTVRTDTDGKARLTNDAFPFISGLRVTVRANGFHPYHIAIDDTAALREPVRLSLPRGRVLRGRVSDSSGAPIENARVVVTGQADVSDHGYFYTLFDVTTDSAGRFKLDAVADSRGLRFEFSHPDCQTRWVQNGEPVTDVTLQRKRDITGTVLDSRGRPIAGARVATIDGEASTKSDTDGSFELTAFLGAKLRLVVTASTYTSELITPSIFDDFSNLKVRLNSGNTITFHVTDESGLGLSDVRVESQYWTRVATPIFEGVTDSSGILSLDNAPEGYHDFLFHCHGYVSRTVRLQARRMVHRVVLQELADAKSIEKENDESGSAGEIDIRPGIRERRIAHYCKMDGTVLRPLIADVKLRNEYDRHGTPDISVDGSTVAYDARPANGAWDDSYIIVANVDGSNARAVCRGVIPSLSPNGSHVAFSRPSRYGSRDGARGQSIWTIGTDGTNLKMIDDNYAWGARWTGDGRSIVYRRGTDEQGNMVSGNCLRVYDLQTETTRYVFTPEESPFQELKFQLNVSRFGRLAAMGGTLKKGGGTLAVIDIDQGLDSLQYIPVHQSGITAYAGVVPAFSADNQWIGKSCRARDGTRIGYSLRIDGTQAPRPFPMLPSNCHSFDPTYAPDGEHVILCLGHPDAHAN